MSAKPEDTGSLNLSTALEEEYRLIHGPLPPDFPTHDTDQVRIRELTRQICCLGQKRTALCFSGGGIRSATYCLGVLHSLARLRLLDKFDYLSLNRIRRGYSGSWLTAWIHRHPRGLPGVVEDLSAGSKTGAPGRVRSVLDVLISPPLLGAVVNVLMDSISNRGLSADRRTRPC